MKSIPTLTIVIPTYRRTEFLALSLDSLYAQTPRPYLHAAIVVDNSKVPDPQVKLICSLPKYSPMTIQYIHQPEPGASNARNLGAAITDSPWIGFIDDDMILPANWVSVALACIEHSGADIIGGPYTPFYLSSPPAWFRAQYGSNSLEEKAGFLIEEKPIFGGNMLWKRELFLKLGGFSPRLGYIGNKEIYGEETELQHRAVKIGARIRYAPELAVQHCFHRERMRVGWFLSSGFRHGQAKALIYFGDWRSQDKRPVARQILSQCWSLIANLFQVIESIFGLPYRSREKYPYWQNYAIEFIRPRIGGLGLSMKMLQLFLSKQGTL
jgi:GT2 family glycosyltransferase